MTRLLLFSFLILIIPISVASFFAFTSVAWFEVVGGLLRVLLFPVKLLLFVLLLLRVGRLLPTGTRERLLNFMQRKDAEYEESAPPKNANEFWRYLRDHLSPKTFAEVRELDTVVAWEQYGEDYESWRAEAVLDGRRPVHLSI